MTDTRTLPLDVDVDGVPRCEIRHTANDPCTFEAVASLKGCSGSSLICARAVREIESHPHDRTCNVCGLPFRECWTITSF